MGVISIANLVSWVKISDNPKNDNETVPTPVVRVGFPWTAVDGNPIYKANIINGKPTVRFSQGYMSYNFSSTSFRTLFFVGNSSVTGDWNFFMGNSNNWHGGTTNWATSSYASSSWYGAATYRNGVSMGSAGSVARTSTNYIWTFQLGGNLSATYFCRGNQSGRNLVGDMAEFIGFSSVLSDADWNAVLSYLGQEYGYSVTLK
jgi:hypothetical protein